MKLLSGVGSKVKVEHQPSMLVQHVYVEHTVQSLDATCKNDEVKLTHANILDFLQEILGSSVHYWHLQRRSEKDLFSRFFAPLEEFPKPSHCDACGFRNGKMLSGNRIIKSLSLASVAQMSRSFPLCAR